VDVSIERAECVSRPGRAALYACQLKTGNQPHFLSTEERCGGERTIGIEGWVWSSAGDHPALPREEISMCRRVLPNGDLDYVVQDGSAKCGQSLGYIDQTQPGLDRFYDGSRHWASTQAVPPQYKWKGSATSSSRRARAARRSIRASTARSSSSASSPAAAASGSRVSTAGYTGTGQRASRLCRCSGCAQGADRFASNNSGCEDQRFVAELGYVLQYPTT
jgi:hypothetical protein